MEVEEAKLSELAIERDEMKADIEADQIDEDIRYAAVEEIIEELPSEDRVIYEDLAGNIFEAPVVIEGLIIEEIPEEKIVEDEFALEDNFDLDLTDNTNEDPDSIPDFF